LRPILRDAGGGRRGEIGEETGASANLLESQEQAPRAIVAPEVPSRSFNRNQEFIVMKALSLEHTENFQLVLIFSNGARGRFDGAAYLSTRHGPLLEPLRQTDYFRRCFIEAGAICWPNGLELSGVRVFELSHPLRLAT
jgi:Protein of unknown function (DUF2442)